MTLTAGPAASPGLDDQRVTAVNPLISPALLRQEHPMSPEVAKVVARGRDATADVLAGRDDRVLVVVGPCSVHDPGVAMDYAQRLAREAAAVQDEVHVVMRVYFEKPRTALGWKGLINDPELDGSCAVNEGLRTARRLLLDIGALGLPVGCEFLDPILSQFIADAVSWGAIGARTAASQVHRQLCSALPMPVGIKNSTEGDVQVAVDATRAAAAGHVFTGITPDGVAALLTSAGNEDCHVILRGGSTGPNHDPATVAAALARLREADRPEHLLIDASHGNSGKNHQRQAEVAAELAARIATGEPGIAGVMLESFLIAGRQDLELGSAHQLTYGQSITDPCLDWPTTSSLLRQLAAAVRARRRTTPR